MHSSQSVLAILVGILRRKIIIFALLFVAMLSLSLATHTSAGTLNNSCANPATRSKYFDTLPNGARILVVTNGSCVTCHGGTFSTPVGFGVHYLAQPTQPMTGSPPTVPDSIAHTWTPALAALDSSGSGYTNGEKLQDPKGIWSVGQAAPGTAASVVSPADPTNLPPQPTVQAITGVTNGQTVSGFISLGVTLSTLIGAREVDYTISDGSNTAQNTLTTSSTPYGGYTDSVTTFNWANFDTHSLPNGTYSISAVVKDARAAGLGGPRTSSTVTVNNVTINNQGIPRYIAPLGTNSGTCNSSANPCATLDYAVSKSFTNDELRLAAGTYNPGNLSSALTITKSLTIQGGFSASNWGAAPDPVANPTILDGQNQRQVLVFSSGSAGFAVKNLTIQHGSGTNGGGVAVNAVSGSLSGVTFANNAATTGGGLYASTTAATTLDLTNVLFTNNTTTSGSAITLSGAGQTTINYATITDNQSPVDAIRVPNAHTLTLRNSLLSGYATGIVISSAQANVTLNHAIAANDTTNNIATPISNPGVGLVTGSFTRAQAGYVNAATGNFHLALGAPAIDTGTTINGVVTDLDGAVRPFNSTNPDIGAFEFHGPGAEISFDNINMTITQPSNVVSVVLRLTRASLAPITVQYETLDSTALAGTDYTASSGTITFNAGQLSQAFDIPILNPSAESLRSFLVRLSSPTGATVDSFSTATVTILPPADPPRVVITASTPTANRAGVIPGVFTISRDVGLGTPLTVHYVVSGSATAGVDYATLSGTITIPSNQYETALLITPVGGSGNRIVTVTISTDDAYLLGRSSASVQVVGTYSAHISFPRIVR